jgi:hypothetical protein
MPKTAPPATSQSPIPSELIEAKIYLIRGLKVMLDSDWQATGWKPVLWSSSQAQSDFMFQLSPKNQTMRSQFVIASRWEYPLLSVCFTEHGMAMLSSVLNSDHAVHMNIHHNPRLRQVRRCLPPQRLGPQNRAAIGGRRTRRTVHRHQGHRELGKSVRTEFRKLESRRRKACIGFVSE